MDPSPECHQSRFWNTIIGRTGGEIFTIFGKIYLLPRLSEEVKECMKEF